MITEIQHGIQKKKMFFIRRFLFPICFFNYIIFYTFAIFFLRLFRLNSFKQTNKHRYTIKDKKQITFCHYEIGIKEFFGDLTVNRGIDGFRTTGPV